LKQSANKRGVYFDISWEDIPAPESCVYLNIPLKYDNTKVSGDSASVDRIDNTKGYIKGNIQTISNKANSMKSVASDEEIVTFSKAALAQHGGYITPQTDTVSEFYGEMKRLYTYLIDSGVCPEQARMFMPQSQLTEWYWTGSLAAFARVCNLRLAPDTQKETRDIAKDISGIMRELYPVSWEALVDSA
jgi:thymidylate synthase ThyX